MSRLIHDCNKALRYLRGSDTLNEMEKRALRPCRCFCLYMEQNTAARVQGWTPFTLAAHLNHVQCMKTLIKVGADEIYSPKYKCIAVQEASQKGYEEIVEILIKSGIRMRDAILGNYKNVVELLVKSGAEVNDGSLAIAVKRDNKEFVDLLLKLGAEVNNGSLGVAVETGNKYFFDLLVNRGADVNDGSLGIAVERGREDFVDLLLTLEANVNICGKSENPPLIKAAQKFRYTGCLETLISAGADVNIRGLSGRSPLSHAAECGNEKLVDTLIKAGANVNSADDHGYTPIMCAAMSRNKICIKKLIEAGADVDSRHSIGKTALMYAAEYGDENAIHVLIKAGANVNVKDDYLGTPLMLATKGKNRACVEQLINAGADVNDGSLGIAVETNNKELVDLLIDLGADVNVFSKLTDPPLIKAALNLRYAGCVETLISAGADVNIRGRAGRSPLSCAIEYRNEKIVDTLINAGANVNNVDDHLKTPLMWATNWKNRACVEQLINAGADVNDGSLRIAVETSNKELVDLLIELGADVNICNKSTDRPLIKAIQNFRYAGCVEALINAGADVNIRSLSGYSPMSCAAECGNEKVVDTLIKAGVNVNNADDRGYTPLICAVMTGNKTCIEKLIEGGADVNRRGLFGRSPLSHAAEHGYEMLDVLMLDVLTKAGANVNSVDNRGLTPLLWSLKEGNKTAVERLIEAGADVNMVTQSSPNAPMSALSLTSEISPELTRLRIKSGADVNIPSYNGGILALSSCSRLHSVCLLLREGTKINIFNHNKVNTLKRHIAEQHPFVKRKMCMLLYAAGEIIDGITIEKFHSDGKVTRVDVPDFLFSFFCLQHLCREAIRRHLINLDPHTHLFSRVLNLPLPSLLSKYLLYDVSLEDVHKGGDD